MGRVVNDGVATDYAEPREVDSDAIGEMLVAVTHVTNPLPAGAPRAVYCTVAGNLICNFGKGGVDVTIPMDAKTWHPICPTHIRATSTATVLLGY
jgi:hypothetical protein